MINDILLMINGHEIDFNEVDELPVKVTFKLFDLEDADTNSGTYSNVFKVPATPRNTLALKPFFDTQYINANRFQVSLPCTIVNRAGFYLFKGTASIKSVSKKAVPAYYEVYLQGGNLDFSSKLAAIKLNTLTLPTLSYPNSAQIEDSWTNTHADKWVAPLACYGAPKWYAGLPVGNITWNNHVQFGPKDFRYWIFLRPLIEEMFQLIGYTLQSSFLTGAVFSSFIMYINDMDIYANGTYVGDISLGPDLISEERTCLDLLRGVSQFFNLKFDTDAVNGIVYCEQYEFFLSGTPQDITSKVDYSKEIKFSVYASQHTGLIFRLKEDDVAKGMKELWQLNNNGTGVATFKDWSNTPMPVIENQLYNKSASYYDGGIGIPDKDADNVKENSFFMGYMMGAVPTYNSTADDQPPYQMLMPLIWGDNDPASSAHIGWQYSSDSNGDRLLIPSRQSGKTVSESNAPRIGYYAGMTDAHGLMAYGFHKTESLGLPYIGTYRPDIFYYSSGISQSDRPFVFLCDHFLEASTTNPLNFYYRDQAVGIRRQDTDFAFQEKREIPVSPETALSNIAMLINDGIVVECYLRLTDLDVRNMSLRGRYIFEHAECRLLEISKYIPGGNDTTLCKFLIKGISDVAAVIGSGNHLVESCNFNQPYN